MASRILARRPRRFPDTQPLWAGNIYIRVPKPDGWAAIAVVRCLHEDVGRYFRPIASRWAFWCDLKGEKNLHALRMQTGLGAIWEWYCDSS